ncbi:MAG: lipoyltransferase [Muribaculaceae bacterium]|nr:lipoyltransferase [Muribaculaceae bacterium]
MIRVIAPTHGHRLPFYLAIEEWVARNMPAAEYFFTWRVKPTVIFGRNQNPMVEVDMEYCLEKGIEVYRRRSGGGCVYADMDNLMMSYITPSTDVTATFAGYTARVAGMLRSLGLDATASGRNDVLIGGKKVSGNAFYHLPGRSIVHGTMLHSTDTANMARAITPSRSKLESNKVASVESRITTISEHLPHLNVDDLEQHIIDSFTDRSYTLTPADIAQVEELEQRYYDMKWRFGNRGILGAPKDQRRILRRVEGVGEIDTVLTLDGNVIADIDITGDFFLLSDLDSGLLDRIRGCARDHGSLSLALEGSDASKVIAGLSTSQFIEYLTT